MGWLKDLLRVANPSIQGYGELARLVLQHPEWPNDTRPQPRSLSALLSKLDRGIELEWLADRPAVQRVLALTLGCSLDAVRAEAESQSAPSSVVARRLRLTDLPYARPFDLVDEPLPPGIPAEVQRSATWRRSWWHAPSGSGRTLTGLWLKARGLAEFVAAPSWSEALASLPASGPTFVEIERDVSGLDAQRLPYNELCIAAPCPVPSGAGSDSGWAPIAASSLVDTLPDLLSWVGARLPEDGAFDPLRALAWLRAPVAAGELPTLGAVLGIAGVLDSAGMERLETKSLVDVARQFVSERLEDAAKTGSPEALWLKRHGFDVLLGLAQSALTTSEQPWEVARSLDEWIALVPGEFRQGVDTEWIRWSLARAVGPTTVRQFEQALKEAPPGAYRLVRALVEARLLRQREPGPGLTIAPEFIKHAALVQARRELLRPAAASAWGEALLSRHAAPQVIASVLERLNQGDFEIIEGLLEHESFSEPALTAALEAAFTCLGLAVLGGSEVPLEHVQGVWDEQIPLLVELPGQLPEPRITASALELGNRPGTLPLLQVAVWHLAALALSELLPDKGHALHPLLRPWREKQGALELPCLLDGIYRALVEPRCSELAWARAAFSLAGRLDQRGLLTPKAGAAPESRLQAADTAIGTGVEALLRPARIARALAGASLRWQDVAGLGAHSMEVRALATCCERESIAWPRMAQAIWHCWSGAVCPSEGDVLLGPESAFAAEFWPYLPSSSFAHAWQRWGSAARAWPYQHFAKAQWSAFAKHWSEALARATPESWNLARWQAAFEAIELNWAAHAVNESRLLEAPAPVSSPIFAVLWRRFAHWSSELAGAQIALGNAAGLGSLLASAPASETPRLVALLQNELTKREVSPALIDSGRRWLRQAVAARRPGWRTAYTLLGDLEQKATRLRHARGPDQ